MGLFTQVACRKGQVNNGFMKKHILFFALSLNAFCACSHLVVSNHSQPLKVCADANNLPFSNSNQEGYENKIAELLSHAMNRPLEYTWYPQRMGFIRNTLKMKVDRQNFKCDIVIGVPSDYDITATTIPYYHSSYAMVYLKGHGLDQIATPQDILNLDPQKLKQVRFGVFAQSPAVDWLLRNNLFDQAILYQKQNGDLDSYPGEMIDKDLTSGKIDVALIWGPIAGFYAKKQVDSEVKSLVFQPDQSIRFDFKISMGVRKSDNLLKDQLNAFIHEHKTQIEAILSKYNIPLIRD